MCSSANRSLTRLSCACVRGSLERTQHGARRGVRAPRTEASGHPRPWGWDSHSRSTASSGPCMVNTRRAEQTAERKGLWGRAGHLACARLGPSPGVHTFHRPQELSICRSLQSITSRLCLVKHWKGLSGELSPRVAGRITFRDTAGKWVWLIPQEGQRPNTGKLQILGAWGKPHPYACEGTKGPASSIPPTRHQESPQRGRGTLG